MVSEMILSTVGLVFFVYLIGTKGNLKNIIIPIKKWINVTKKINKVASIFLRARMKIFDNLSEVISV